MLCNGIFCNITYEYLEGNKKDLLNLKQIDRDECINLFQKYKENGNIIY